jgi:nitrogen-specific signal transduction histidine kinase
MRYVSSKNIAFEAEDLAPNFPNAKPRELQEHYGDSLSKLASLWGNTHEPIEILILDDFRQNIYYFDSEKLLKLEQQRDSLLNSFNQELIDNTTMVPVIFIDESDQKLIETNIDSLKKYRTHLLMSLDAIKSVMVDSLDIALDANTQGKLYFDDSKELKQLKFYPYLQFSLIGLFIFIGYIIFSTFRKAEQNQVWAGMAKETAHQLGTPISSLMAWIQLLETQGHPKTEILEMNKDIDRLTTIADRFEKIGSGAKLEPHDLNHTVQKAYDYLRYRLSKKVDFDLHLPDYELVVLHNPSLIEWVLENICKNAVDAMDGKGTLSITVSEQGMNVHIDIKDSGRGIPSNKVKTIFQPGYTTKQRGWGLGLSLVKRIVDTYHKGRVFVLQSELNKGTTFRVTLRKP